MKRYGTVTASLRQRRFGVWSYPHVAYWGAFIDPVAVHVGLWPFHVAIEIGRRPWRYLVGHSPYR